MSTPLHLTPRTFPARLAELGFTADLPADWIAHELPSEDIDFSNPTVFAPLAVVTAPHAAIVFAFAARPAYDDGTLQDWTWYHLNNNKLKPRAVGDDQLANVPAVIGEATQESEVGTLVVRFAFFEDGDRFVNITLTAPELLADAVRDAWFGLLKSFQLETPKGSRFPLGSAAVRNTPVTPTPKKETPSPAPAEESKTMAPEASDQPQLPKDLQQPRNNVTHTFAEYALDRDTTSLDPETMINANLRAKGIGLVPRVVAANGDEQRATVAAGAVMAQFEVPYGWHVIDDGKRTLIFEPSGKVQINLNLLPREGRNHAAILDGIEAQARQDYPQPEFMRVMSIGGKKIHALGIRNIADGDQPIEQYHLLAPFRDAAMVLRARVTATPERATDACNLAELILDSCVFDCFQQRDEPKTKTGTNMSTPDGKPEWWHRALALEAQNKLKEAEETIQAGCPYQGYAYSTAEMYRLRMVRLKNAGDDVGALEACRRSSNWIFFYASMATSGGEGAALSMERDQFRAELIAAYGSDPDNARS